VRTMPRFMIPALIALGAMVLPAAAQTPTSAPKPAAASAQVFWVFTLRVQPDQFDQLKALVTEIAATVAKTEPGTLEYEWNITADHRALVVFERYADSAAVVEHGKDFGPFAKRFFALAKPRRLAVFGAPDAAARKAIAPLHPIYLTTFAGFTR